MNAKAPAAAGFGREPTVAVYRGILEAWNRRDADGFAALFTETGSVVGFDGSQMNGRREIAETLRAIFTDHQTARYVARIREVRALGGGAMLLRAVAGMIPPGKTEINPAVNAVQSLVVVPEAGSARIALLHNTPAALHGRPHLVEQLTAELTEVARQGQLVGETGRDLTRRPGFGRPGSAPRGSCATRAGRCGVLTGYRVGHSSVFSRRQPRPSRHQEPR